MKKCKGNVKSQEFLLTRNTKMKKVQIKKTLRPRPCNEIHCGRRKGNLVMLSFAQKPLRKQLRTRMP
jgi:hypothetical protein